MSVFDLQEPDAYPSRTETLSQTRRERTHPRMEQKLTRRQEDVLCVVDDNGPVTVADVAYHWPIGEASARGILSRLEHRGLIDATYTTHRSNARAYVITARGKAALAALHLEKP